MRLWVFIILLASGCAVEQQTDPVLFTSGGKDLQRDDLPESMRPKIFNAQVQYYQATMKIIRESVIDIYLTEKGRG